MPQDDLLTTTEVASLLGVATATVRNYARAHQIDSVKLPSGHRRYRRSDVEALLVPESEGAK